MRFTVEQRKSAIWWANVVLKNDGLKNTQKLRKWWGKRGKQCHGVHVAALHVWALLTVIKERLSYTMSGPSLLLRHSKRT